MLLLYPSRYKRKGTEDSVFSMFFKDISKKSSGSRFGNKTINAASRKTFEAALIVLLCIDRVSVSQSES